LKPLKTGRIKTKRKKLRKKERVIHCIKSLRYIEKENTNILFLVKCSVPGIGTVKKKGLCRMSQAKARLIQVK
jgi:hypothetical protein